MQTLENTKTVYDLVTTAGKEYGEKIFLKYEDNDVVTAVTYSQFVRESMGIAAWIEEQNIISGRKIHVALLGSSSHRYLNALIGVLMNGNVAIPLDPQLDAEKLADNLTRAEVDLLIYDWEFHDLIKETLVNMDHLVRCVCFQSHDKKLSFRQIREEYMGKVVKPNVTPEDLGVIIFTSGTTGRGKGVMLSQGNIIDNVFCTDVDKSEYVYLSVLPIHHVFCFNTDMLYAFRFGYLLCLNQDIKKLIPHLVLFKPTNLNMVPQMARLLINRLNIVRSQNPKMSLEECKAQVFGSKLRMIDCGGGYLPPELAKAYMDIGISVGQGYGLSEVSPKVTYADHNRPEKIASVGRIVLRCEVKIIDGEICVKSPSVMQGYYKDPEETAKVIDSEGYFHTGDLGYVDDENYLFFTGRKKNLIVLSNGENVAPEEIENAFANESLVEDVLVYDDDDTLACAIYPNFNIAGKQGIEDVDEAVFAVVAKVNETLPSFKRIQKTIIKRTPFAKTTSKKIIRQKFFDELKNIKDTANTVRKPENDFQRKIYDIISSNLGHTNFGIDTDLYACGLDSMGSVMLLTDLHEELGFVISLKELMENPTVLKLEEYYNESSDKPKTDYTKREIYPLTTLQTYFAYVLRGNTTGNLPFLYKLSKKVDLDKLKAAVEGLFEIHPELKATIKLTEKGYVWVRDDERKIDIPIIEVTKSKWTKVKKELIQPFMFNSGEGIYHIGIYKVEGGSNYLFLDIAHIMGDGISMGIVFQDINDIYAGNTPKKSDYNYYEFILDEIARKSDEELRKKDEDYFIDLIGDYKIRKSILVRHDSCDLSKGKYKALKDDFSLLNKTQVENFCKKMGVSENVLFLTAFNLCISLFSNEKDVLSTSIHSGRVDSRWNRITGPLFTTYIFRYKELPNEKKLDLLKRNANQVLTTMEDHLSTLHADEMFFQYQGDILDLEKLGGEKTERTRLSLESLPFHLQVFTNRKTHYYELRYWENRFDVKQLEVFMECFENVVAALMEDGYVRDVKKAIPEKLFPKHLTVSAKNLRTAVGKDIVPDIDDKQEIRLYVLDAQYNKLPFGGWGDMYIADIVPLKYDDVIESPYKAGRLYKLGYTGRILPDGKVDILETNGRSVMIEGLASRTFPDLYKMEELLKEYDGVEGAECYVSYQRGNKYVLCANITGTTPSVEDIKEYMESKKHPELVPGIVLENKAEDVEINTYEQVVEFMRNAYSYSGVNFGIDHLAIQFNIVGKGEGAFYLEIKDGRLHVEPYEYYDRDALITTSAEVLKRIADGKIDAYSAFLAGDIQIEGNLRKELLVKVLKQ